ncbi:MAG: PilZ domain-containing protein [Candidatus Eremiobacteraeota bacterium]|nr:PilZ domain-containing protein [Candidatus Eremiobacteraeota bacterium]
MNAKTGWFGASKSAPTSARESVPSSTSLECATTITARGVNANAVIEHLTASQCRLRSVVMLDIHAVVEFDVTLPGRPAMAVRGRVAARNRSGPRFSYTVALDRMTTAETDALARSLAHSHRHRVNPRLRSIETLKDIPVAHGLMRAKLRQASAFTLSFRTAKEGFKTARADNVSTGGLLVTSPEVLVEGMVLELQFTLPSEVLDVYPEETTVIDVRNLLKRRTVPSKLRRPFTEMAVQARITRHQPLPGGVYQYGLAFLPMERETRQEIARYVDALRHLNAK